MLHFVLAGLPQRLFVKGFEGLVQVPFIDVVHAFVRSLKRASFKDQFFFKSEVEKARFEFKRKLTKKVLSCDLNKFKVLTVPKIDFNKDVLGA